MERRGTTRPTAADPFVVDASWRGAPRPTKPVSTDLALAAGLVLEDPSSGFVGAVKRWENGLVVLENRRGKLRSFPIGPGFWYEGKPVTLVVRRLTAAGRRETASGSLAAPAGRAKVALPSRIYVEGRHDAELVEKVWGDDLRSVGVVVEFLGGVDSLAEIVEEFRPEPGRRLGVLVDHLVAGSKESRIAERVAADRNGGYVLVTGHPFIDIWQAVKPASVGIPAWPEIARSVEWKYGVCAALGWPHDDQIDIAAAWRRILAAVKGWRDLERPLRTVVEQLIDYVTQDRPADLG
jgi:hypothetical protein